MVSTRNHPSNFPEPLLSPSKAGTPSPTAPNTVTRRSTRSSTAATRSSISASHTARPAGPWAHTPSPLTLFWLLLSLPLVFWDTGYVLLRPHSMPGGWLNKPLWTPYDLYGTVDYIYGLPAWEEKNGFTAAQACLNILESVGYIVYLGVVFAMGVEGERRGVLGKLFSGNVGHEMRVQGKEAGVAVLVGFAAAVMTLSKTLLYGLNEHFSGYHHIGHNDLYSLIFLWIIPNGAWIIGSAYMTWVFGQEILEGLALASGPSVAPTKVRQLAIKDE